MTVSSPSQTKIKTISKVINIDERAAQSLQNNKNHDSDSHKSRKSITQLLQNGTVADQILSRQNAELVSLQGTDLLFLQNAELVSPQGKHLVSPQKTYLGTPHKTGCVSPKQTCLCLQHKLISVEIFQIDKIDKFDARIDQMMI